MLAKNSDRRSLKSISLTRRFHWPYIGLWAVFDLCQIAIFQLLVIGLALHCEILDLLYSSSGLLLRSFGFSSFLVALVLLFGLLSAHRQGGVHVKTEAVMKAVAEGDLSQRLRYRQGDGLAEVEAAFDRFMTCMTTARPNAAPPEQPAKSGTSAELGGDRRSWKNFSLTSRHHYNYRGLHVLISFSLLALTSYTCVFCILCLHLQEQAMTHLVLALTLVAGAGLFWQARSKAHELAGVHLKLAQTLRRVSDGEKGVTLRFRSSDKLENLELAFEKMMLSLERQRGRA